ncbi:MAG: hypothetical protein HY420_02675 [Candidatus Kerfeldbacteria bacterium]|nr:hypothetical protein [Candidatus Kerfeldbacteria bacterium]
MVELVRDFRHLSDRRLVAAGTEVVVAVVVRLDHHSTLEVAQLDRRTTH